LREVLSPRLKRLALSLVKVEFLSRPPLAIAGDCSYGPINLYPDNLKCPVSAGTGFHYLSFSTFKKMRPPVKTVLACALSLPRLAQIGGWSINVLGRREEDEIP